MLLSSLTIAERERLAYIEGFTNVATMLASLDDCHRELAKSLEDYSNAADEIQTLHRRLSDWWNT
jgi:hypothetical protein